MKEEEPFFIFIIFIYRSLLLKALSSFRHRLLVIVGDLKLFRVNNEKQQQL